MEITTGLDYAYTLTQKTIGDIRGQFVVPDYQRGYRWDKNDVRRLLEDIWDSQGQEYSLQPIVVKLRKLGTNEAEHEWELIDGQQRLTTLFVILRYMMKHAGCGLGAPYALHYETRKGSQDYLDTMDESSHLLYIDYFHLFQAHQCIAEWFDKRGDKFAQNSAANTIHGYLFNSVRVIWYKAPASSVASEMFTRLNVGRIPLTDAELIKAALLSAARSRSTDRAHEIAAQWDSIERDLHRTEIWGFVAGLAPAECDEKYPTRISLLLDTLADAKVPPTVKRPRYHAFDMLRGEVEEDHSDFWKKVVALHAQILGWAEIPKIFNKIGFLVASGDAFGALAHTARGKKKSDFEASLVNRIRGRLRVKDAELEELSYEDRKSGYPKLLQLLVLMNIETTTQSGLRFPFSRHIGQKWSLEHIHAQNTDVLNTADQWKTWLINHLAALKAVAPGLDLTEVTQLRIEVDSAIAEIEAEKSGRFSGERFNALSSRILRLLNKDDAPDHSIRNMALLSSSDNSRLSNSVFEVKRQMILELDRRGEYVPVCTRNVFLKYYSGADSQQPHYWSEADKRNYLGELRSRLKPYFVESGHSAGTGK